MTPRPTREYSREFRPHGRGRNFTISRVPAGFLERVKEKAKREGVSLRALLLRRLQAYLESEGAAP